MKDCAIQTASHEDVEELSKISWVSKGYWGYPEEWMNLWKDGLTITKEIVDRDNAYKLALNSKIIGFVIISEEEKTFEIEHCWLLPEYIGKGYGSFMLKEVLKSETYRNKKFKVEADPNAVRFYEKFGFKTVGQSPSLPVGRSLPLMEMTNHVH